MTRRIFFGLIPALLAAANWPFRQVIPKRTNLVMIQNFKVMLPTQELLDDVAIPAGWLETKVRSEIEL